MEKKDLVLQGDIVLRRLVSKKGSEFIALGVDLGYTFKFLTYDSRSIAEMLGLSVIEFMDIVSELSVGQSLLVVADSDTD